MTKPIAKSTLRYKYDKEYRVKIIKNNKEYRQKNNRYPVFRKLHKLRNSINNWKDSINYHRSKIVLFQNRIYKAKRLKESLELEWGALRAQIKKELKEKDGTSNNKS